MIRTLDHLVSDWEYTNIYPKENTAKESTTKEIYEITISFENSLTRLKYCGKVKETMLSISLTNRITYNV